jgi:hypothetical protein
VVHAFLALDEEPVILGIEHRSFDVVTGEAADRLERV